MASERSASDGFRPGNECNAAASAWLAVVGVAGAISATSAFRCLRRTARLARQTQELSILSRTDPLTGLHNRRHVEEHLAGAASAARRHHQPLSVLFIDIDNFKTVNDHWGYEAGDEVLRAVADRINLTLRTEDLVGRWGGEEFVAVLAATDLPGARVVAERVRTAVATQPIQSDGGATHVTVSVGCASCAAEMYDPAELIRQASRALREAKQRGKNQVVAAPNGID
jgi:diguanylate cyclase (GGDEF)-like protein